MKSIRLPEKARVAKLFVIILFLLATLIRIVFIHCETIEDYQYDVGTMNLKTAESYKKIYEQDRNYIKEYRHLDYIMTIYNTGKLPDSNKVQQYHPPLHHLICVGWLKILDFSPLDEMNKLESLQILTCIYSIASLYIILKICDELKLNNFYRIIVLLFVGFNPMFVIMSGFISNDMLVSMLILLCFYLIIQWHKKPSYKNTILLGLVFGLGCATKTSMTVMGIVIFCTVIEKWISSLIIFKNDSNDKTLYKTKTFLIQTLIFLLIATPLSLAYPYRNYKKFNQPILYVVPPKDELLISETNIFKRFSPFSQELFENELHEANINVFSYAIKSNLIFSLRHSIHYFTLLKFLTILLFAFSIASTLYLIITEKDFIVKLLIATCLIWLIAFISFNIDIPASCTMHAKYIYCYIALLPIVNSYSLQKANNYTLSMSIYAISTMFAVFSTFGILMILF